MLTNSQNASYFDNLRVRKISNSEHLQVRNYHADVPNIWKEFARLSDLTSLLVEKF